MPYFRLDRILCSLGIGTRKEIKKIISNDILTVNSVRIKDPSFKVDTEKDIMTFSGKPLVYREFSYIMMNKPQGVISASDDKKVETVIDLLPEDFKRPNLFPAGRLDKDTEGFLLITNDGSFAHNILSPKKHIDKEYFAIIDKNLNQVQIEAFENGLNIGEDNLTLPAKLKVISTDGESGQTKVSVIIHEGKFHQIKRMFEAVSREVLYLKRVSMGKLKLDDNLSLGECRYITDKELELIFK